MLPSLVKVPHDENWEDKSPEDDEGETYEQGELEVATLPAHDGHVSDEVGVAVLVREAVEEREVHLYYYWVQNEDQHECSHLHLF